MDIAAWLRELGLERYEQAFRENDVDAEILPKLTGDDLSAIGVASVGHRRKLLEAIEALAAAATAAEARDDTADGMLGGPLADSGGTSEAERRQLTVLFCDLVGSTELASKLDPEDMGDLMRAYHGACTQAVGRWDGHVAKFMGDGVLAYFGYPHAHEDDAERAVRAALDLVDIVAGLAVADRPLAARVGIATGLVMVGELIGEGASQEQTVVGETPNLAARLQTVAEPSGVVISPATRRLTGAMFNYADLGRCRLKGLAEPVQAWRVLGPSRIEGRFEARQAAGLTPLVGREHDLGLLLGRWEQARDAEGQAVLLCGEAGIGKSRLVRALRERLADEPHTSLRYQCSPHHANSALYPIIDQLERAAGLEREDAAPGKLAKLEALLAEGTDDVTAAAPLFAALLSIPYDDPYPRLNLTPQRRKDKTLEALLAQLQGLAAKRPVLMVLEDAHWVDPTTQELFELVVNRIQSLPVMLVITHRPEFSPPWHGRADVTTLTLNRLGRRQVAAIVERVTGGKALPSEVTEQIVAKTDGVPLYVEELAKTVLESELLRDAGDRYELTGPLPALAIPATLHDSLMARLDRLAPVKEVAQIGAVVGREFDHELLAAVVPLDEEALREALRQLTEAELLFRRGTPPEATYSFKHALVQDAAYQSLLRSRRQQLHARIAQVLERDFAAAMETRPEVLAHHYTEADLGQAAVDYWLRAGQRAIERSAYLEAIAHLRKGLSLLERLADTPERSQREYQLQSAVGGALVATKGFASPEVEAAYLAARDAARRMADPSQLFTATWGLWLVYQQRARFETAQDLLRDLFTLADRAGDPGLRLQAHHASWTTSLYLPDLSACWRHAEQGIALYDGGRHHDHKFRYGGHDPGACCRYNGAVALWQLGYPQRAAQVVGDAVALAEELAHPVTLAVTLMFACFVHQHRREASLVQDLARRTIALCAEQGLVQHILATGAIMQGWANAVRGAAGDSTREMRQGLDALQATSVDVRRPYYLALFAEACARDGELDQGLRAIAAALDLVERTGERRWEAEIRRLNGELLLARSSENRAQAEACFRTACEIARNQSGRSLELRATTSLARLWAERGERRKAHDLLAPVYGWFTEGFDTADLKGAKDLLEELA